MIRRQIFVIEKHVCILFVKRYEVKHIFDLCQTSLFCEYRQEGYGLSSW